MSADQISERGVRIGNELLTFIPADSIIRPLRDQIVVEPLPTHSLFDIPGCKPIRGIVRATGPGCYPKRYDGPKGKRTRSWDAKCFRPCDVRVGDVVELGGSELGGYLFARVFWGDKEVVICREEDVAIVREGS